METKNQVFESTIGDVAENSLFRLNTVAIAKNSGCSEAFLFKTFKTKRNLLLETYFYILESMNRSIAIDPDFSIRSVHDFYVFLKKLWKEIVGFYLSRPEYAVFLSDLRLSGLYNREILSYEMLLRQDIVAQLGKAARKLKIYRVFSKDVFWSYFIDATVCFVKRIIDEVEEADSEAEMDARFDVLFTGMFEAIEKNSAN